MPHAKLNGVNLYFEERGAGDSLVLIAGLGCATDHWGTVRDRLGRHHRLLMFDNRGVGKSDAPDAPYSIEMFADDTIALMDYLRIERADILGYSMGGCIAQMIALKKPDRIKKLILSNTVIHMSKTGMMALEASLHLRQEGVALERVIEVLLPWSYSSHFLSNQKKVEEITRLILNKSDLQTINGFKRQLEALAAFDSSLWCNKISVPTLVIAGSEDILCLGDSEKLAARIGGAQLAVISSVAHAPMIEKPREYVEMILQFLHPSSG